MNVNFLRRILVGLVATSLSCSLGSAQNLNEIGAALLDRATANLNGAGIRVAQAEAQVSTNPPAWEVDPASVNQPESLFSYFSSAGSATAYPNSLGTNSYHAAQVAAHFYSLSSGIATNVAHVDNYEADYFYNSIVNGLPSSNIGDIVVNQSFVFTGSTVSQQQQIDSAYDNYAVKYNTLFVNGAGNGGPINPPATCYNGIGVGVSDGTSSYGPTVDNGRCKPDIIAPGQETSYSTPYVAGAAALLLQAAIRGDGGSNTNSAADLRTVKALLLNGAVKPVGWTNSTSSPLDARYGAGVLNVFNSYEQLADGQHGYIVSTSVTSGSAHPPTGSTGTIGSLSGWDFNSISSTSGGIFSSATDGANHYYFDVTDGVSAASITLVWNRMQSASSQIHSSINNLALFLYNAANSNLVTDSVSLVDNVQHIFVPELAPGRYDLQVWKAGGSGIVSASESYGLAWSFVSPDLSLVKSGANAKMSWPAYPAGFLVQSTTNLATGPWSTASLPAASYASGTNSVLFPATNTTQFFRLRSPNF